MTSDPVTTRPRVLLLGDGPTTLTALRSLTACCTVVGVLRAASQAAVDPVRAYAAGHDVPVRPLDQLGDLPRVIGELRPDVVVISSFSRILSADVLALSRFINVHYSPLPRYRGRANVNWAIINGEPTAAISIHMVRPGLDDGEILLQEEVAIAPTDTAGSLYERLNGIQERELGAAVLRVARGETGSLQNQGDATYGCGRTPDDGEIDWSQPTVVIDRLIRALSPPFPGAFTHLDGQPLRILRAAPALNPPRYDGRVPGRVVGRSRREGWVDVLTGDGVLRLFNVATEASGEASAATLVLSTRATLGLSRLDLLRRIESLEARLKLLEAAAQQPAARRAPPRPLDVPTTH